MLASSDCNHFVHGSQFARVEAIPASFYVGLRFYLLAFSCIPYFLTGAIYFS